MRKLFFLLAVLLISACASTPVPAWKDNAYRQLENYKKYFLTGREDAAEPHFIKARKEISAGNDLNLLATVLLTNYALHASSLEIFDDSDFLKLNKIEPNASNLAYRNFLKGNFDAVDLKELPKSYAGIQKAAASRDVAIAARELAAMDDPLSRLVACGVWVTYLPYNEKILQIAISTASIHGWRRPLSAYLKKLHGYYWEHGEPVQADAIKKRLEILNP